jgi:DNA-binding NarL/FixJ family response regulator
MELLTDSIAVIDDHFLIAEAIEKMILDNTAWQYYGGFANSRAFEQKLADHKAPEFLLLDINLQDEDGILLCKKYAKRFPGMKIIMLTGLGQPAIVKNAMKNGAKGFMLKNMQREELWECLDKVKQGDMYLHPQAERLILKQAVLGRVPGNDFIPKLSRREKEVLELILQEMTTQEIAATLFISVNTVETHRASLFSKTGSKNIAGLVKTAIEKGLLDE